MVKLRILFIISPRGTFDQNLMKIVPGVKETCADPEVTGCLTSSPPQKKNKKKKKHTHTKVAIGRFPLQNEKMS